MLGKIWTLYRDFYLKRLKKRGLLLGNNFQMEKGCNIDANFPWLISIGDNVTLAMYVYLVAHDGASKKHVGYSKIGLIRIGDNVFIGARSIVLPNVKIGNNSIIGANSVVTHDIPENCVAVGSPAKVVSDIYHYEEKLKSEMAQDPIYEREYTLAGGITNNRKEKMRDELCDRGGVHSIRMCIYTP